MADRLITPFAVTQHPARLAARQWLIRATQGCLPSPLAMHNSSASLFPVAIFPCLSQIIQVAEPPSSEASENAEAPRLLSSLPCEKTPSD